MVEGKCLETKGRKDASVGREVTEVEGDVPTFQL
jgi:hypothetical protein